MIKSNGNDKNEDDIDIEKSFEEEINKPYYKVDYLDGFKLPYEKMDVSVVIATYNRCPYKPGKDENKNPLVWAVKSCFYQKPKIKEIIIVDDKSDDYTKKIVEKMKKESEKHDISITYLRNSKKLGPGMARNIGAKSSNSKYIHFIDDDCFITPYSIFGSVYTFEKLTEKGIKVGLINLPTYKRASIPSKVVPKKDIGELDFVRGVFKTNKEAFPQEYLDAEPEKKYLDNELHILNPFPILNVNTTSLLCFKKAFEEVGGFREHLFNRGEDREFGCRIFENGYAIYFQPDPKFHCVHGSYGLHSDQLFEGNDWFAEIDKDISLKKTMKLCNNPAEDSGTRVNPKEYLQQTMLTNFFLTYQRNKKGAINWIKRVYDNFVVKGETKVFGNGEVQIADEKERKKRWLSTINEGLRLVKKEERKTINKINKTIDKLDKEQEVDEDIFEILESLE